MSEKLAYTWQEAAKRMSLSENTLRRLVDEGNIFVIRTGERKSRVLIPHCELQRYIDERLEDAKSHHRQKEQA